MYSKEEDLQYIPPTFKHVETPSSHLNGNHWNKLDELINMLQE